MKSLRNRAFTSLIAGAVFIAPLCVTTARAEAADAIAAAEPGLTVEHAECAFFGPLREHYAQAALNRVRGRGESSLGALTRQVSNALPMFLPGGSHNHDIAVSAGQDTVDAYIFADLQTNGIKPADSTNDFEFIRRVTLDLTGRIPTPDKVIAFVNNSDPAKRSKYIDTLLQAPEWVDKWTMFYGDLFRISSRNSQIVISNEGRNAYYKYLHDSLAVNKPYNQIATELITAQGSNNYDQTQGQMNFLIVNIQSNGPTQDVYDAQTAAVAEAFLGMAHVNCVLCHNGRGHLDSLSLWGSKFTRAQAWQLSSFMSHTSLHGYRTPPDPNNPKAGTLAYWSFDTGTNDYTLNTTIGNRPARQPIPGGSKTVSPVYLDGVSAPAKGSDYRAALAHYVTGDMQFARAAVNYVWAHFFGMGIVDPPDQFDLARLDPANPPPAPWTLQPTNPQLLDSLARHFIEHGYDLKALMREITNSQAYQFSSRYQGDWNATYEPYFARHFVRRLWGEEIHDSLVTATGVVPTYNVPGFSADSTVYGVSSSGFGRISFAMQSPDVLNTPDGGGAVSQFLDSFQRGDRDLTPRKGEGSILQALNLMNDNLVQSRIHATGSAVQGGLLATHISLPDDQLVNTLYLAALSRYPSPDEMNTALTRLKTNASRTQAAEDLFWVLFNKVDFVFNY